MAKNKKLESKLDNLECNKCKFKHGTFVPPQAGTELMFVMEAPDKNEIHFGKISEGRRWTYLYNHLAGLNINPNTVHITNTVLCYKEGDNPPTPAQTRQCMPHIWDEINSVKPKLIVLVGEAATKACLDTKKVAAHRGIIVKKGGHYFLPIHCPSYLAKNSYKKDLLGTWVQDLNKINRFLNKPKNNYWLVDSENDLEGAVQFLNNQKLLSFDIETNHFDNKTNMYTQDFTVYTASFSWAKNNSICIPLSHPQNSMSLDKCVAAVKAILTNNYGKIIQNIMFEYMVMKKVFNIEIKNIVEDTMLMQYILDPEARRGLKYMSWKKLPFGGHEFIAEDYEFESLKDVAEYNMEDTDVTFQLYHVLKSEMLDDDMRWLHEVLMPKLAVTLCNIQKTGNLVDVQYLKKYRKQYEDSITILERELLSFDNVPANYNVTSLNSPKQLQHLLFDIYKLPPIKETKTGYSTDAETLKTLANKGGSYVLVDNIGYLFCGKLLDYRQKTKMYRTYLCNAESGLVNGRRYSNLNITGTVTGRLSSNLINQHNEPKDKEYRKMYVAAPNHKLIGADYSQIEVRCLAMWSLDATLIQFYKDDKDVHEEIGAMYADKPITELTEEERFIGKNGGTFPIIYGEHPSTTAAKLGITVDEYMNNIRKKFFELMPSVETKIKEHIAEARKNGYVRTLLGRIRYLDYKSAFADSDYKKMKWKLAELDRKAVNTSIQGTATDLNSYAAILILDWIKENGLQTKIWRIIHDQVILESPDKEVDIVRENVVRIMEGLDFDFINVPLKVDMKIGDNFSEL